MASKLLTIVFFVCLSASLFAQDSRKPITNSDVLSMTKAGLKEQTIVLAIEQGPSKFDTSPQALVNLKSAGVLDAVLNAMIVAANKNPQESAVTTPSTSSPIGVPNSPEALKLVEEALNAYGMRDKLTSVKAYRMVGSTSENRSGAIIAYEFELQVVYPDRAYFEIHDSAGAITKVVVTPQAAYVSNGQARSELAAAQAGEQRTMLKFDLAYVAQHMTEFTFSVDSHERVGANECERLRVRRNDGAEQFWSVDLNGKIVRRIEHHLTGDSTVDYSEFQWADGLNIGFRRRITSSNGITQDTTIKQYQVNPSSYYLNAALSDSTNAQQSPASNPFPAPADNGGLTLRVLEAQSVPYVQKLGGSPSTSCNITGGSNTNMSASTIGNYTYGNASTTTGLHMNCNSYDTTMNWPHILNVMLVVASDGNAYMIACDRAWAWSKCVPLRSGDTFNARSTSKGFAVQAVNAKGKESEPTYVILQSKALR
jgi:hypothetical protein